MSNYKDYKKKVLQNPEIKSEYDALQPEYDIIQAMIDARLQQNLTQKDLSARTGITQAWISCTIFDAADISLRNSGSGR